MQGVDTLGKNAEKVVLAVAWHIRHVRKLIYGAAVIAAIAICLTSFQDAPNSAGAWISARELYGLWALSLLLASMFPGPLNYVCPWLPIRPHLVLGRRAMGVSAFGMAVLHVACYLVPLAYINWRMLFEPGMLWITGQVLGLLIFVMMAVLAFTSRNSMVRRLRPGRWKKWHRSVYLLLPVAMIHATLLGADFGVNKGPDVEAQPDAGCLITFSIVAALWLLLALLRSRRIRLKFKPSREAGAN